MKKGIFIVCLILITVACEDITEIDDITNKEVTILAPTNEAVLNAADITFSWEDIESAESYNIQIATPTFENANQIILESTLSKLNLTKTLPANSYEWRIRTQNSGYQTRIYC